MSRKFLVVGIIGVAFLAGAMLVVSLSGPRTAYQPINLMNGSASGVNLSVTQTALSSAGPMESHLVQSGETLYEIALDYHVTIDQIVAANGLNDSLTIYAGQTLFIPMITPPAENVPSSVAPDSSLLPAAVPTQAIAVSDTADLSALQTFVPPTTVNGIPIDTIVVMPQGVIDHIRNIFSIGQSIGRNPRAFSKLGDSTIENPHFLTRFDGGPYNLGNFAYLQAMINFYTGSFGRQGDAVHRGLHTWSVFDPMWATSPDCQPGENMLICELRVQNSSVLIIHLGSNDAGVPDSTEKNFRQIVEYCMNNGVIPILGTKADRHEGSNINNGIIRKIAFEYNLPLWDFDAVASTLPGKGLAPDGTHMTSFFAHDWRLSEAFQQGYGLMNLTALIALDKVWRAVMSQP